VPDPRRAHGARLASRRRPRWPALLAKMPQASPRIVALEAAAARRARGPLRVDEAAGTRTVDALLAE
jgi:hypothetical protein